MRSPMVGLSLRGPDGVAPAERRRLEFSAMRRGPTLLLFLVAAACWLAAGPGGATLQAALACRQHALHQSHDGHHPGVEPTHDSCLRAVMTGGPDLGLPAGGPDPPTAEPDEQ